MAAIAGKMEKRIHNWSRYAGYRFDKYVGTDNEKHKGHYFMEILEADVVVHSGPNIRGVAVYDPTRTGQTWPSSTSQLMCSGGWRHSLTAFFDFPDPLFLYPLLDKGVSFSEAFKLGQKHENNARDSKGDKKRIFGHVKIRAFGDGRTVDDVELEYIINRIGISLQ